MRGRHLVRQLLICEAEYKKLDRIRYWWRIRGRQQEGGFGFRWLQCPEVVGRGFLRLPISLFSVKPG